MAPHFVLSRWISFYDKKGQKRCSFYRISCSSESEEWSSINLYPQFPKKINAKRAIRVDCSGDGLLCIFFEGEKIGYDHVIWNPSTDKSQLIPPTDSSNLPCVCSSRGCAKSIIADAWGIGFVPESHDYKFVIFLSNCNSNEDDSSSSDDDRVVHSGSEHVSVYSSKTNSWKELPFPFEDISPLGTEDSTCVNGFVYWMSSGSRSPIISFDLSSDKFSTIPYPDDTPHDFIGDDVDDHDHLLQLDGSLCLVIAFERSSITKLLTFYVYAASSTPSSPWTRKINLDVRLDADVVDCPLWLGKKNINGGEFLMLRGFDGSLLAYDYTTRELDKFDQMQYDSGDWLFITPYVETHDNIAKNKINSTCDFDGWTAHLRPHSKRGNNDIVDWISQLPDDMIVRILSLLSLKDAASTSVLSTRWSDLWRYTPNLNFHDTHLKRYKPKYIEWVNTVVESHKALSLKEFSISFPIDYSTRSTVIKWLEFAFSRRVEVLELDLFGKRFAFLQKFLRKSPILKSANLRSLCLKCLTVSGRAIGLFLRNCPLLERLIIISSVLKSDLEVCGSALKHLDIQYCTGGKSIKGYAPNLTSLKIDSAPFSLNKVDHHLNLAWSARQSADEPPLLPFISSQLTTLEFTLHFPPKGYFGNRFPQVPTLRELIVTYLRGHGIRPITSLICAFPYLEEFEIKCFRRRHERRRGPIDRLVMDDVENVEGFCHCHLRVLKFTRFDVGDGDHMELMSYILNNCIVLQKIILDIYGADSASYVAAGEYAKQLQSKLRPTHIQLIISINDRQLV